MVTQKDANLNFLFKEAITLLNEFFFGQGGSEECPISDTRYYERHKMNKHKTLMQNLKEIIIIIKCYEK